MSNSNFSDYLEELSNGEGDRESAITEGLDNLKSKIKDVETKLPEAKPAAAPAPKAKVTTDLADRAISTYKDKIAPPIDAPTSLEDAAPKEMPATIANRENLKAVARSLAGLRNGGDAVGRRRRRCVQRRRPARKRLCMRVGETAQVRALAAVRGGRVVEREGRYGCSQARHGVPSRRRGRRGKHERVVQHEARSGR